VRLTIHLAAFPRPAWVPTLGDASIVDLRTQLRLIEYLAVARVYLQSSELLSQPNTQVPDVRVVLVIRLLTFEATRALAVGGLLLL